MGNTLVLSVTDNGIGMSEEKIKDALSMEGGHEGKGRAMCFSGIGIGNVHARIRLQFGEPYGLSIYSREQLFTTVEIHLPVVQASDSDEPPIAPAELEQTEKSP
jgi:two-component system sensor histidine kinase YesM